ncbi:hypothetical protein BH23ACT3_BH23ACT3_15990 [soil metagenome]
MSADHDVDTEEEERERYRELLEELRTIIPGVQVLFAFLLTAPFSSRFEELDEFGRDLYAAALTGVALAAVILLTPAAYHRLGSTNDRSTRLKIGIASTVVGLALLSASVVTSVFVVIRFVFDDGLFAELLAGLVGIVTIVMWYGLSLGHRLKG